MDMSFANQALCSDYLVENEGKLDRNVHPVPQHIDGTVARIKLESLGVDIDSLTEEQTLYIKSWEEGT